MKSSLGDDSATSYHRIRTLLSMHMSSQQTAAFDASSFSPPPSRLPSFYDSYSSQESASSPVSDNAQVPREVFISKSQVGGLSRSRCIASNLSSLGSSASETSISRQPSKQIISCSSCPSTKQGWGYFVDTPHTPWCRDNEATTANTHCSCRTDLDEGSNSRKEPTPWHPDPKKRDLCSLQRLHLAHFSSKQQECWIWWDFKITTVPCRLARCCIFFFVEHMQWFISSKAVSWLVVR